jgi:histidinol-phosphate aminotransferase
MGIGIIPGFQDGQMTPPKPRSGLLNIKPHMASPGSGPLEPISIDLSSNESAYGPGYLALEAGRAAMSAPERYIENAQGRLAAAISERFGHSPERIVVGYGSDDLLARLARGYLTPGSELVRSRNGYLKVPNYAHANDAVPVSAPDVDFRASVEGLLACLTPRTKMVYVANPENPAGTYLDADMLRALHGGLPSDVLLVVDAAYEEYVDAPDFLPAAQLVDEAENVVMTRTFSKIFGLAGLRIGWAYGPPGICDVIRRIGITFPVSTPALAAGVAALSDRAHTAKVFELNRKLRLAVSAQLEGLGLRVLPSQGNFVLVEFPAGEPAAAGAYSALRAEGIATRRFVSKAYEACIRLTLGREDELDRAVAALSTFQSPTP